MKLNRPSLMACAGLVALASPFLFASRPAFAASDSYSVDPSQRLNIELNVCSPETQLVVQGDSSTDLDFEVTDPQGNTLVSDAGIDDYLSMVLTHEGQGCGDFSLAISNLGDEKNDLNLVLEPVVASSTRVKKYIVQGNTTEKHEFRACGTSARVSARGDGDTDLDFVIRNSDGGIVHEDDGTGDETSAQLTGLLSDCEAFEIEVSNLGSVYNAMMLVVTPEGADPAKFTGTHPSANLASRTAISTPGNAGAGSGQRRTVTAETSGPGQYTAPANAEFQLDLPVCTASRLEVRGNGASDLDFTVLDGEGREVHSDVDLSDVMFKSLNPKGGCETFGLSVNNLGGQANVFEVALIDPATRVGDIGAGEYLIGPDVATKVGLQVCQATRISARGQGVTDLDFTVTDAGGSSVHADYDLTDETQFTLDPGGTCKDYQIAVNNLGSDGNMLTIAFGEDGANAASSRSAGPYVAGPTRPTSGIARPGQIIGFRKGERAANGELNRNVSLLNKTGEALESLYWSNSATIGWGEDRLSQSSLARDQQWNIEVTDGSNACLFDFRAVTKSDREIELGGINVCEESVISFE